MDLRYDSFRSVGDGVSAYHRRSVLFVRRSGWMERVYFSEVSAKSIFPP